MFPSGDLFPCWSVFHGPLLVDPDWFHCVRDMTGISSADIFAPLSTFSRRACVVFLPVVVYVEGCADRPWD